MKKKIIHMFASYIGHQNNSPLQDEQKVILAGAEINGEEVVEISAVGTRTRPDLFSRQEEADTRIFLHVTDVDQDFGKQKVRGRIIIQSPDTDVLVVAIHCYPKLQNTTALWFQTGSTSQTGDHRRYIPVHEICNNTPPIFAQILPAIHALTGSDTTSALYRFGKKSVMNIVGNLGVHHFNYLEQFGHSDIETDLKIARKFIVTLYDPKGRYKMHHNDLTSLRCAMASKVNNVADLPPPESAFLQHVKRASYQTKIWITSHLPSAPPTPIGHGWMKFDQIIKPLMFDGPTASELLAGFLCRCPGTCRDTCACVTAMMPCCELCSCTGDCGNKPNSNDGPHIEDQLER